MRTLAALLWLLTVVALRPPEGSNATIRANGMVYTQAEYAAVYAEQVERYGYGWTCSFAQGWEFSLQTANDFTLPDNERRMLVVIHEVCDPLSRNSPSG